MFWTLITLRNLKLTIKEIVNIVTQIPSRVRSVFMLHKHNIKSTILDLLASQDNKHGRHMSNWTCTFREYCLKWNQRKGKIETMVQNTVSTKDDVSHCESMNTVEDNDKYFSNLEIEWKNLSGSVSYEASYIDMSMTYYRKPLRSRTYHQRYEWWSTSYCRKHGSILACIKSALWQPQFCNRKTTWCHQYVLTCASARDYLV